MTIGILMAGGNGTRLQPLTRITNKHLFPLHNKPMIYYSLSILLLAEIRNIYLICRRQDRQYFYELLGDGDNFGVTINYITQTEASGIAECFNLINDHNFKPDQVMLVLGDNILFGASLKNKLLLAKSSESAVCFGCPVDNPKQFGVIEIKEKNVISLEEKPLKPKSNLAVTGVYVFPKIVFDYAQKLDFSKRGELEIVDVLMMFLRQNSLKVEELGRGTIWYDAGTFDDFTEVSYLIKTIEHKTSTFINCPEEIAYRSGFISRQKLKTLIKKYPPCAYRDYLNAIC